MKKILTCSLIFLALTACGGAGTNVRQAEEIEIMLPEGAVPFERNGHIYMKMMLMDTIPANIAFDTGADGLYLDKTFLSSSGYVPDSVLNNVYMFGAGDGHSIEKVILDSVNIFCDAFSYASSLTTLMDLKTICGKDADGILGTVPFRDSPFMINYRDGYILRMENPDSALLAEYVPVPVRFHKNRIMVPVEIETEDGTVIAEDLLLDTGAPGSSVLSKRTTDKYKLNDKVGRKKEYRSSVGGVGGSSRGFTFRAKRFKVGGFEIEGPLVSCSHNKKGVLGNEYLSGNGIFGNQLLSLFTLIIDIPGQTLYLKPDPAANGSFPENLSGFNVIDRTDITGGWIVYNIYEDSAGEKAGLKFNDIITEIDGIPTIGIPAETRDGYLFENGKNYVLTVRRGDAIFKTEVTNPEPYL